MTNKLNENVEWWENNVFWKVIFRNLTPETQQFIKDDVAKTLNESARLERERILGVIEYYFKGLVMIPDPQATCKNLIEKLKSSNEEGV